MVSTAWRGPSAEKFYCEKLPCRRIIAVPLGPPDPAILPERRTRKRAYFSVSLNPVRPQDRHQNQIDPPAVRQLVGLPKQPLLDEARRRIDMPGAGIIGQHI